MKALLLDLTGTVKNLRLLRNHPLKVPLQLQLFPAAPLRNLFSSSVWVQLALSSIAT